MKHFVSVVVMVPFLLATAALTRAAPGDPDVLFGDGGTVVISLVGGGDQIEAVAVRSDGTLVAAAYSGSVFNVLIGYENDGGLDLSFGTNGTAYGQLDTLRLRQVSDGDLVASGSTGYFPAVFALGRYHRDGSLPTEYGSSGLTTVGGGSVDYAADFAEQGDGRLVAVGTFAHSGSFPPSIPPYAAFAVVRFETDGQRDPNFPPAMQARPFSSEQYALAYGVVLGADDSVIAVGEAGGSLALVKLDKDGVFDPTFGSGGTVVTPFPDPSTAKEVDRLADGRLVVAGETGGNVVLLRYLPDGSLDPSFGSGGIVTQDLGGSDELVAGMAARPDGSVLLAVVAMTAGTPASYLLSFRADGTIDPAFGSGGIVTVSFPQGPTQIRSLVRDDADRTIVVGGLAGVPYDTVAVLARYLDGALTCPATPAAGCKHQVEPLRGSLGLKHREPGAKKDIIRWQWQTGEATALPELGNPTLADDYVFCIYDESSGSPTLRFGARAPAGGLCRGKACWAADHGRGFKYADPDRSPSGLSKLKVGVGDAGKTKVDLQGKGTTLGPLPALPLALPARAQLIAGNGQCWEAVYSNAGLRLNDTTRFKGAAD